MKLNKQSSGVGNYLHSSSTSIIDEGWYYNDIDKKNVTAEDIEADMIMRAPQQYSNELRWKKPEDEMPKDQQRVAVIVRTELGNLRIAIAEHVSAHSIKSEDFLGDEMDVSSLEEYDEKEDCYYVKENWFESNLSEDINYVLCYKVLAWAKIEIPKEISTCQM